MLRLLHHEDHKRLQHDHVEALRASLRAKPQI